MRIRRGRATVTGENFSRPFWKPLVRKRAGKVEKFDISQKPGDLPPGNWTDTLRGKVYRYSEQTKA